jgi:hypothetical protein
MPFDAQRSQKGRGESTPARQQDFRFNTRVAWRVRIFALTRHVLDNWLREVAFFEERKLRL